MICRRQAIKLTHIDRTLSKGTLSMNPTVFAKSSLKIAQTLALLAIVSGCASTPKSETVAEAPIGPAPELIDLLTDRALAQAGVIVKGAATEASIKGSLTQLLSGAASSAARVEAKELLVNAAIKRGYKLDRTKSLQSQLSDEQIRAIFSDVANEKAIQSSKNYDEVKAVLTKQEASQKMESNYVNLGDQNFQETVRHISKGFGKEHREVVKHYISVRHYTKVELMTPETCTVFPGKLTAEAAQNVKKYWGVQARTAEEIAAIKGLNAQARNELMIQRGYCKTVEFFKNELNVPANDIPATIETASGTCKIVPGAYMAALRANVSCN